MIRSFILLMPLMALLLLAACTEKDQAPLEGERISVLELQKTLEPENPELQAEGLITPAIWRNEFWPQSGGYPNHSMQNLDLSTEPLKKIWSADIGEGSVIERPLTAQPVVADGRIFTLDTDLMLSAFDITSGKSLWRVSMMAKGEEDPVISGGVAFGGGLLYVTNGYNELIAVTPADGKIAWRRTIPAPSRAAPTVLNDRVFITTLDNRLLALNAADGAPLWDYTGLSESAGLIGAASPAASRDIVVPVFSSGEITALRVENGSVAWTDNLANVRRTGGLAALSHIRALPVIDKGLVVAMSFGGRLVGLDEVTGTRVWQREIGGANTPWMAGNHLFVLSSQNELVALGREKGSIRWVTQLQRYEDPDDSASDPINWAGPVLAGGRLILAGTDGRFVEINPETGKQLRASDMGDTVDISPVVAGGTLYLLSEDGVLSAYR